MFDTGFPPLAPVNFFEMRLTLFQIDPGQLERGDRAKEVSAA